MGVVSIDSPTVFCPGAFDVYATIQNNGKNEVTSVDVNWTVDGLLQSPLSFTGSIDTIGGSGSSTAQVLLGNFNFSTNNLYDVKVWTSNPNGVPDTINANDTISSIIQSNLPPPSNISTSALAATQATLTWTGGSANSWLWVNVPAGNPLIGNGTATSSAFATITGLVTETGYDFYVREVCASGDTSTWAGPFFYKTPFLCPPNAYCFLTGGATGQFGPDQTQLNAVYSGTPLSGQVTVNGGIQDWSVPAGGLYEIQVFGAQGGGAQGGRGASASGDFVLNSGDVLNILVGQEGTENDNGTGGGGGSFVVQNSSLLLVAGGGGGNNGTANSSADGQAGTSGLGGTSTGTIGAGGTAGSAGVSTDRAQAGAGWLQDGPSFSQATTDVPAQRFLNGGEGGFHTSAPGGLGGFGGGGGSWNTGFRGSGGGGGYSGGGSGSVTSNTNTHAGGGAGSFNSGSNQVNTAGVRFDDGVIIIRALSSGASDDIGVVGIDSPAVFCPGIESVWASINNFGTTQVTSATVNWSVDGAVQTPAAFTGTLDTIGGTGNTTAQILLGTFNFNTNNPYNVSVWTTLPNGNADTVGQNDTANRVIQSSLPAPTGLNFTNLFATAVNVSWNPGALANSWLWVNVPSGTAPTAVGTASSNPNVQVTGLSGNTDYDFYVREVCPSGDTSVWAGPFTYTTPCAIYIAPFFEDFDGPQWSLTTPFDIDQCWNRTSSTAPFWRTEDLTTSSTATGPATDISGIGKYVYLETSGGSLGQASELESPPIDISGLSAPQVEFFYHMFGADMGILNLDILDNGTWTNIWTLSGPQQTASTDPWISVSVPVTATSDTIQFRFEGVRGNGFNSDMAVDEVRLRDAPNNDLAIDDVLGLQTGCGLTNSESFNVVVENKGAFSQNNFDIEYSVNSGAFIVGTTVTTALTFGQSQTYTINNVDLSGSGQKCIDVRVVLANDEDTLNNISAQNCISNLAVPSIDSFANGEICNTGIVNLSAQFTGDNLIWYDDAGLTNQVASGNSFATPVLSSSTTYFLRAENANGCNSPVQPVLAEVNQTPSVNFSFFVPGTNGQVNFTGIVSSNTDRVEWAFGTIGSDTVINPVFTFPSTGSYLTRLTAYDGTCDNDTSRSIFVTVIPVKIDENSWNNNISLYPNPGDGMINLTIGELSRDVNIQVTDLSGQIVHEQVLVYKGQNELKEQMDLRHLNGTFILKLNSGDKQGQFKILIK
jgi:hypothetical protein